VERALEEYQQRPRLTPAEELVVATHEAGHALCALHCEHAPVIERISIRGDISGALGSVSYADPAHRYVVTRQQQLDAICTLYGGREAELLLLDDVSAGAARDLQCATSIARQLVEDLGLGDAKLGLRCYADQAGRPQLSEAARSALEKEIDGILAGQRQRARRILAEQRPALEALRALLLEHKVVDRTTLAAWPRRDGTAKVDKKGKRKPGGPDAPA
jgi:cell division protease FtsH